MIGVWFRDLMRQVALLANSCAVREAVRQKSLNLQKIIGGGEGERGSAFLPFSQTSSRQTPPRYFFFPSFFLSHSSRARCIYAACVQPLHLQSDVVTWANWRTNITLITPLPSYG